MNSLWHGCIGLVVLLLASCGQQPAVPQTVFVTEHGLGPDKWATAWLLTRHVVPGAGLVVAETDSPRPVGTTFDMPGSDLQRVGDRSVFEVAQEAHGIDDPDVARLAQIVNDIEVNFWAPNMVAESAVVEQAFRELQRGQTYGEVPPECYMAFFDAVYDALRSRRVDNAEIVPGSLAVDCGRHALVEGQGNRIVPEVAIPGLLEEMERGKSVIFVDVREANEYGEAHIPGALNITLRELDAAAIDRVQGADYVVAYCVKDFRGFEMAKALREAGVQNAVILQPYGMKGWLSQGLPMAGSEAMGEIDAQRQMAECISAPGRCLSKESAR